MNKSKSTMILPYLTRTNLQKQQPNRLREKTETNEKTNKNFFITDDFLSFSMLNKNSTNILTPQRGGQV